MKNLFLNVFRYSPAKCFFLVFAGSFTFITPVSSTEQNENVLGLEAFSHEMVTSRVTNKEIARDSLNQIDEFSDDSKQGNDHSETTISFAPSGGLGWGLTSQVIP